MHSIALSLGLVLILLVSNAKAAQISKVKGDQVLIDGVDSDSPMSEGDKYFVMIDGKKKGLIEITKSKGTKAIGKIVKGKAEANAELAPASGGASSSKKVAKNTKRGKSKSKKKKRDDDDSPMAGLFWGGLLGIGMDSQSVTISNPTTQTVAMSGMGYNLRVFGDMPFTDQLGGIARVGIEQMNLSGSGGASTTITYLSGDVLARFDIMQGTFVPFVAAGISLNMPVAQSSSVLGTIASVMTFPIDGGIRYSLDSDMYIIALAEYLYFPASSNVTTSIIAIRGGLGMRF